MNARQQLEEYRRRQEERFKKQAQEEEESDDEEQQRGFWPNQDPIPEYNSHVDRDLEYARQLEAQLNFRYSPSYMQEREEAGHNREDDIGEEGHPAPIPQYDNRAYQNNPLPNYNRHSAPRR